MAVRPVAAEAEAPLTVVAEAVALQRAEGAEHLRFLSMEARQRAAALSCLLATVEPGLASQSGATAVVVADLLPLQSRP